MSDVCEKHGLKLLTYGTLVRELRVFSCCSIVRWYHNSAGGSWLISGLDLQSPIRMLEISHHLKERSDHRCSLWHRLRLKRFIALVSWHDCQGMGFMGTFSGLVSSTKKHRKSARKKYRKHCDTMGARPSIRWCSHNRHGFYYSLLQCCSLMLRVVQEHASDFPSIQTRIATYLASTWPNMTTLA